MIEELALGGAALGALGATAKAYFRDRTAIPYEYASTRIKAKKGKLLRTEELNELAEAKSLAEVTACLEGNPMYEKPITEAKRNRGEEEAIYETLRQKCLSDLHFVYSIAPGDGRLLVEQYAKKYEIENIKNALRLKSLGLKEELMHEVYASLGEAEVRCLFAADSVEAIAGLLASTEYSKALSEGMKTYRTTGSLIGFEAALDAHYLKGLQALAEQAEISKNAKDLLDAYISCAGIKALFRAMAGNVRPEEIEKFIVTTPLLSKTTLRSLTGGDIVGAIERLGTRWQAALEPAKAEFGRKSDVIVLERALDAYMQKLAKQTMEEDPLGPGIFLGYLLRTENELRNLRTITAAKSANLPPEKIKGMLI